MSARVGLVALLALAALVRVGAAYGDLWLDEVWALELAWALDSPIDAITELRHSTNHPSLTLWFMGVGPGRGSIVYRLPSIVAGVLACGVAAHIAGSSGRLAAALALGLSATSFLGIHFSSEARGYGLLVLCALGAFALARRYDAQPSGRSAAGFWLVCALGVLSHLLFVFAYVPVLAWSALRFARARSHAENAWRELAWLHGPALAVLGAFVWAFFVRGFHVADGPEASVPGVIVRTASLALGGPVDGPGALATAGACGGVVAAGLVYLWRRRSDELVFYALAIGTVPMLALVVRPDQFYERYLLTGVAFLVVLSSLVLAELLRRGGIARVLAVAGLLGVTLGNARHVAGLLEHGRGEYRAALALIGERSGPGPVTVGSDWEFQTEKVLRYYASLASERPIEFVRTSEDPEPPEWLIAQSTEPEPPDPYPVGFHGARYQLTERFHTYALSGFHWFVYRRVR